MKHINSIKWGLVTFCIGSTTATIGHYAAEWTVAYGVAIIGAVIGAAAVAFEQGEG